MTETLARRSLRESPDWTGSRPACRRRSGALSRTLPRQGSARAAARHRRGAHCADARAVADDVGAGRAPKSRSSWRDRASPGRRPVSSRVPARRCWCGGRAAPMRGPPRPFAAAADGNAGRGDQSGHLAGRPAGALCGGSRRHTATSTSCASAAGARSTSPPSSPADDEQARILARRRAHRLPLRARRRRPLRDGRDGRIGASASPRQDSIPRWSPDGKRLAYSTEAVVDPYSRVVRAELWTADVESGATTRVWAGDAVQPSWSPHGTRIAFWANAAGQRDIWTIAASGGTPVAVTSDAATDWAPEWSPDGRALYFVSDRGGSPNLWRVTIDESSGVPARRSRAGDQRRPCARKRALLARRFAHGARRNRSVVRAVAHRPRFGLARSRRRADDHPQRVARLVRPVTRRRVARVHEPHRA